MACRINYECSNCDLYKELKFLYAVFTFRYLAIREFSTLFQVQLRNVSCFVRPSVYLQILLPHLIPKLTGESELNSIKHIINYKWNYGSRREIWLTPFLQFFHISSKKFLQAADSGNVYNRTTDICKFNIDRIELHRAVPIEKSCREKNVFSFIFIRCSK